MPRRAIVYAMVLAAAVLLLIGAGVRADDAPDDRLYWYQCDNVRVVDGDTVECNPLQLGLDLSMNEAVLRLFGINAPETRGEERPDGLVTKRWLAERIGGESILIRTVKDERGKFGRYLAEVFDGPLNLNAEMVRLGLAEVRNY